MNLGGCVAQSAAPIIVKVLLEDDSLFKENAVRSEINEVGNRLPIGSFFSISVCSHSPLSWKWISGSQAHLPLDRCIEEGASAGVEENTALLDSVDSASAEVNGIALRAFQGHTKSVQKWIVFVKNSNSKTTIAKTGYLSTILKRCMEENCTLIRIDSSSPHKITAFVDGTVLSPDFCARMVNSSWGWLSKKIENYVAELRARKAAALAESTRKAQAVQETSQDAKALEAELLAIAKGVHHI